MSKRPGYKVDATGRSKKFERYVRLEYWMLTSAAYRSLSANATRVLIDLMRRYNGTDNDIIFSIRMATEIGIGKDNAGRALDELMAWGFIRIAGMSAFSLKTRTARTWRLTMFKVGAAEPTKEFMSRRRDSQEIINWENERDKERKSRSRRRDKLPDRRDRSDAVGNNVSQSVAAARQKSPSVGHAAARRRDRSNIPPTSSQIRDREQAAPPLRVGTKSNLAAADVCVPGDIGVLSSGTVADDAGDGETQAKPNGIADGVDGLIDIKGLRVLPRQIARQNDGNCRTPSPHPVLTQGSPNSGEPPPHNGSRNPIDTVREGSTIDPQIRRITP